MFHNHIVRKMPPKHIYIEALQHRDLEQSKDPYEFGPVSEVNSDEDDKTWMQPNKECHKRDKSGCWSVLMRKSGGLGIFFSHITRLICCRQMQELEESEVQRVQSRYSMLKS